MPRTEILAFVKVGNQSQQLQALAEAAIKWNASN